MLHPIKMTSISNTIYSNVTANDIYLFHACLLSMLQAPLFGRLNHLWQPIKLSGQIENRILVKLLFMHVNSAHWMDRVKPMKWKVT